MPSTAFQTKSVSVREYYDIEATAQERSDYYAGEMFNMAGGTTEHAAITANLLRELGLALKGKPCRPLSADQRLKSEQNGLRIYPDASVFCEPLTYDEEDGQKHTTTNPTAIFEVLSDGTEAYDRGFKFESFRSTPSLQAYILIAQDRPHVEVFDRSADRVWTLTEANGLDSSIPIGGIEISLHLADLYERIEFSVEDSSEGRIFPKGP
ncbi:MAG: Uma2 family endonuclease [Verrucomicrobiota bacterium]